MSTTSPLSSRMKLVNIREEEEEEEEVFESRSAGPQPAARTVLPQIRIDSHTAKPLHGSAEDVESGHSVSTSRGGSELVCSSEVESMRLEDQLTNQTLQLLEHIFEEADEDGGGGLDMAEFRHAMRRALGPHLTDTEIDMMFMKVDTNCDGTVDWDEYLSYMLLEYREKDQMNHLTQEKTLSRHLNKVSDLHAHQRHHESVIKLVHLPALGKGAGHLFHPVRNSSGGNYISITKEGVVNTWGMDMSHRVRYRVPPVRGQKARDMWVMDAVVLPNIKALAVATTAATISFYDLGVGKFPLTLQVVDLEIAVTCMTYWFDPKDLSHAILLWGDGRGAVQALEFQGCDRMCVLQRGTKNPAQVRLPLHEVVAGTVCGTKTYRLPNIHDDFVLSVQYHGNLNAFISCCRDHHTALYIGDLTVKKKKNYFHINKGVSCFDYSRALNVIVTAGKDTIVRVWNPYVPVKPVMVLQGHKSAVTHIVINECKEQIISISEEKDIHIFDMNTQVIVQSIFQKFVSLGARPITALLFNQARQALLLATNQLAVFEHRQEDIRSQELHSHGQPVNVVLYNKLFHQVVSGGSDSTVVVWDLDTGLRHIQFQAHRILIHGEEVDVEITAMQFDPTLRRLLTAARDGSVKMWNFNNGALLRQLAAGDPLEVTSIVFARRLILTAGWGQRVHLYVDSQEEDSVQVWPRRHQDDMLCMAYYPPSILATAAYDGDLLIWSLETGHVLAHFNASVSSTALQDISRCNISAIAGPGSTFSLPPLSTSSQHTLRHGASQRRHGLAATHTAIEKMVFFTSRPNTTCTASLFTSNSSGWMQAWSVSHEGGLLAQWNAAHKPGAAVLALATDQHNEFLITGDSDGYIKVWHMLEYGIDVDTHAKKSLASHQRRQTLKSQFPFLKMDKKARDPVLEQTRHGPPPVSASCPSLPMPLLVASWQGHLHSVVSLSYADGKQFIVSCSPDCSVRLWTISGQFLGIFGQNVPWKLPIPHHRMGSSNRVQSSRRKSHSPAKNASQEQPEHLPPDVRKVASAATLKVLHGGRQKYWRLARHVVLVWVPMLRLRRFLQQRKLIRDVALPEQHQFVMESLETPVQEDDQPDPLAGPRQPDRAVSPTKGAGSPRPHILGKHSQMGRKHQVLPKLPEIRQFANQVSVYSALKFHELDDVEEVRPPQTLLDIQERNRRMMAHMRDTCMRKARVVGLLQGRDVLDMRRSRQGSVAASNPTTTRWRKASTAVCQSGRPPPANSTCR